MSHRMCPWLGIPYLLSGIDGDDSGNSDDNDSRTSGVSLRHAVNLDTRRRGAEVIHAASAQWGYHTITIITTTQLQPFDIC